MPDDIAISNSSRRLNASDWYEDESEGEEEAYSIDQYDLTASPNDFNVLTIVNFIDSGAVVIPGFQRNYVWDLSRASRLIESLIIGIPVPQLFLYEEGRNKYLVIDGQQRLMTIYYFVKQRFPVKEKRGELRRIFAEHRRIPESVLHDDNYFTKFNLRLPPHLPNQPSKFHGLNYQTLGEYQNAFDLRTIRNVIVKQLAPKEEEDSAVYEIFNRLNTGGINLFPQEIRMSLYHSAFYDALLSLNLNSNWRRLLGIAEPDLHMKDVEFLLRACAALVEGERYMPSMTRFLNGFSRKAKSFGAEFVDFIQSLVESFFEACSLLPDRAFYSQASRFSVTIFEAIFAAALRRPLHDHQRLDKKIAPDSINALKHDPVFIAASEVRTTDKSNVLKRLERADHLISFV